MSTAMQAPPAGDDLRTLARQRIERSRKLKWHVAAYVLGMIVLTPVWALVQWQDRGGFERFRASAEHGNWDPWIFYVALIWGLVVAIMALRLHFDRPTTQAEIEREVERLTKS